VTELRIPQLGVSMEEGVIVEWYATDGAQITAGSPIYRLESEKVVVDIEAPTSGVIHCKGAVGTTYRVGDLIGEIN
jgi:pyruvate/2-oxoglutarate dehydrogenase complex dihydrolipoamide acyltransferase (E2) component